MEIKSICVVGDFNEWNSSATPMKRISEEGVWEATVIGATQGQMYKYEIPDQNIDSTLNA